MLKICPVAILDFTINTRYNEGLHRTQHMIQQLYVNNRKVGQVYIKSKCGHRILLVTVNCWTQ